MRFTDEIKLKACSGKGGDGIVSWRSLPGKPKAGPDGGDGGKGGDVYIEAVEDIFLLSKYRSNSVFVAENGENGKSSGKKGANGRDVIIKLPVGSIVKVEATQKMYELTKVGEKILILRGGKGGFGNQRFKSSVNRAPKNATKGKEGICSDIYVELRVYADVGLVGFPSAGKSSLINKLTNANSKVGAYSFTTLDPVLGVLESAEGRVVVSDIPGIIEGASEGKGLGNKFLKHITRVKALIFCISVERDNPKRDFEMLRKELSNFSEVLLEKKYAIALTKSDLVSEEELVKKQNSLSGLGAVFVQPVSVYDDKSIKNLKELILQLVFNDVS